MMVRTRHFMSDVATLLLGTGASVRLFRFDTGVSLEMPLLTFLRGEGEGDIPDAALVITVITVPYLRESEHFRSYRVALRSNNAHALVNAAMRLRLDGVTITEAQLAFGCVGDLPTFASAAEAALIGKSIAAKETLRAALAAVEMVEVEPKAEYHSIRQPDGKDPFRQRCPTTFLYKFLLSAREAAGLAIPSELHSAATYAKRDAVTSSQTFQSKMPSGHPGASPRPKLEAKEQASGESVYHDDLQPSRPLFAAFVHCTTAPALVVAIDARTALTMPGVVDLITAADVPAFNNSSLVPGEEFLFPRMWDPLEHQGADDEALAAAKKASRVLYVDQPVAAIVARSRREAEAAAKCVQVSYDADGTLAFTEPRDVSFESCPASRLLPPFA